MAGAGYKLFNTGDVLTAAQVNTFLMEQTVMVFASAAARTTALSGVLAEGMVSYLKDTNATEVYDGSAWVAIGNSGDITGVTAGTGISGGGTTGTVTITNDMATTITAKGDIVAGTGNATYDNLAVGTNNTRLVAASGETTGLKWVADTQNTVIDAEGDLLVGDAADLVQRLAIGTTGQVLTVDTTLDGKLKWATPSSGGQTLLSTTSLSGASTTVSSISTAYNDLLLVFEDVYSATDAAFMRIQFNGDTGNKYAYWYYNTQDANTRSGNTGSYIEVSKIRSQSANATSGYMYISNYNNTVTIAGTMSFNYSLTHSEGGSFSYNNAAAITEVKVAMDTGNISGGTLKIYGVK